MQNFIPGGRGDLPHGEDLDIIALSQSLDKKNTSYKFLWLLALLECVGEADDSDAPLPVPMRGLAMRMLKIAEPLVLLYKLNLGRDDRMKECIEWVTAGERGAGRQAAEERVFRKVREFVPQQWLVPFLKRRGHNLPTEGSDARAARILRLASEPDAVRGLPYNFAELRKGADIVIDRRWRRYFKRNNEVVRGWAMYCFAEYVQARNPHTPGIVAKLAHPEQRGALTDERKWWKAMMAEMGEFRCIYSGQPLRPDGRFDLDHFVPWSFVGHNRIWNLVPVAPEVNSAKSDRLPSRRYLDSLIIEQQRALEACTRRKGGKGKNWNIIMDAYPADLQLDVGRQAPSLDETAKAFRQIVPSLMSLAASRGFEQGWTFRPPRGTA